MGPVPLQEFIDQGRQQESNGDADRKDTEYERQDDGAQGNQPQLLPHVSLEVCCCRE